MTGRTVVSVDLAHSTYASNGIAVLRQNGGSLSVQLTPIPLTGQPDPTRLARFLIDVAEECGARLIFLDGPQGWRDSAADSSELRVCERKLAAPAKTGLPGHVKPANYAPFVKFSIAVFDALHDAGWPRLDDASLIDDGPRRAVESFPLAAWRTLKVPALPAKAKAKGEDISSRLGALRELVPITTDTTPSHDELQAIVAGLAGFPELFDVRFEGVQPRFIDGYWREGFIVSPKRRSVSLPFVEETRFTIRKNRWYAWQMMPGYLTGGYFSPIHVRRFEALKTGKGLVEIGFFNAGYAEGVQDFFVRARVMKRTTDFVLLDLEPNGSTDRIAIISDVSTPWLSRFAPEICDLSASGEPDDIQMLLDRRYGIDDGKH